MEEDDYRQLIVLVQQQLREHGLAEISDETHYLQRNSENGEVRLPPPGTHLVALLEAFGRHMAVRDVGTYWDALAHANEVLARREGGRIEQAQVVGPNGPVSLGEGPKLGETREHLKWLVTQLRDGGAGSPAAR